MTLVTKMAFLVGGLCATFLVGVGLLVDPLFLFLVPVAALCIAVGFDAPRGRSETDG
jgi:hypothetical protein